YPLWIISFWSKVLHLHCIQHKWAGALAAMQKVCNKSAKLLDDVTNALNCNSWGGTLQGFEIAIGTHYISAYATQAWLSRKMMELRISTSGNVKYTQFPTKLSFAYTSQKKYAEGQEFWWACMEGEKLARGVCCKVGMIANINVNHWVAIVLDFANHLILYGDSLHQLHHHDLIIVLEWWMHHHTGFTFEVKDLLVSHQTDGYSCGLLAWNALVIYFLGEKGYLLIKPEDVDNKRLMVMLHIIERHNDQV
ncbi:hypothetical protein L208DRAFT_1017948, partial [Tricholoma matsutake]